MISFCRGEMRSWSASPAAPPPPACCDCEYSRSNGWASMKKISVCELVRASRASAVEADQVARHEIVIFEIQDGGSAGLGNAACVPGANAFCSAPPLTEYSDTHFLQAEIVLGLHFERNLFDRAGAVVAAGAADTDRRRGLPCGLDEIVLGEADALLLVNGGDVIDAVLFDPDRSPLGGCRPAEPRVISSPLSSTSRPPSSGLSVSMTKIGLGPFDGPQVASVFLGGVGLAKPLGIAIGDLDALHLGQVDDGEPELAVRTAPAST